MEKIIEIPSPNFTKGRSGQKIEAIVIHIMAGSLIGTNSWFSNPTSEVSAHYGIGLQGQKVRYVNDEDTAWHAGQVVPPTSWNLLKQNIKPNFYTIGIEHEGYDLSVAPQTQLNTSAELIKSLCAKYNIPIDRDHIVGHYQIKATKPNCPATDKTIIDKLIALAKPTEEITTISVPKSKVAQLLAYLKTI